MHTIDISEAVNHRESAILAPGRHDRRPEHNPARGLFLFWRRVRAALEADRGRQATNDRLKSLPSGLVRLPPRLWTTRQTPRVPQIRTLYSVVECE